MDAKILTIDDDSDLVALLRTSLQMEGYRVLWAKDGVEGLRILQDERPDLVLLDLMLPRMDGWETCRRIREHSDIPIIMLTAVSGEVNLLRGLELGADDYVIKPFSVVELKARIRASLRRCKYPISSDLVVRIDDHIAVDRTRRCLIVDGQYVELSPTEYKLVDCFLCNPGRILSHQTLLTQVWGWEYAEETHYLKVYIYNLRKKMEKDLQSPRYILTERGLGYRFQLPER
jgi:two-component system, OmpR family, KDP operon response regulator KdpE